MQGVGGGERRDCEKRGGSGVGEGRWGFGREG